MLLRWTVAVCAELYDKHRVFHNSTIIPKQAGNKRRLDAAAAAAITGEVDH